MLNAFGWIGQGELIEPAMFFFAGLLVSGLAGLLILPAFARRALRLSAARARLLAPLSVKDIVAERDLLRAEHALERHRLERRLATLQEQSALHRADLGRRAAANSSRGSGPSSRSRPIWARASSRFATSTRGSRARRPRSTRCARRAFRWRPPPTRSARRSPGSKPAPRGSR
jgi:hypothetical protein